MEIMIVRRPIGEAPNWVRDAWIGLRLPLATPRSHRWIGFGVLSAPPGALRQIWAILRGRSLRIEGFRVDAKAAVNLLHRSQPAAAEWWRSAAAWMLDGRQFFIFDLAACELVPDEPVK